MKVIMILGSLVVVSVLSYVGVDAYLNTNPEYVFEQKYKNLFIGGEYAPVKKVFLAKTKLVSTEGNWEIFSDNVTGNPCYFKFQVENGKIENFKTSGKCLLN